MRDCGGAAVVLETDPRLRIGLGQAERPGRQVAGTCRPGLEGTRGHSIRAGASKTVPDPIGHRYPFLSLLVQLGIAVEGLPGGGGTAEVLHPSRSAIRRVSLRENGVAGRRVDQEPSGKSLVLTDWPTESR